MARPVISPEAFIAEVNKRLPGHHAYKPGMRVFLVPKGATSATAAGYDFEPGEAKGVVANIVDQVLKEYDEGGLPPVVTGHP
jgi:hypothetical protein